MSDLEDELEEVTAEVAEARVESLRKEREQCLQNIEKYERKAVTAQQKAEAQRAVLVRINESLALARALVRAGRGTEALPQPSPPPAPIRVTAPPAASAGRGKRPLASSEESDEGDEEAPAPPARAPAASSSSARVKRDAGGGGEEEEEAEGAGRGGRGPRGGRQAGAAVFGESPSAEWQAPEGRADLPPVRLEQRSAVADGLPRKPRAIAFCPDPRNAAAFVSASVNGALCFGRAEGRSLQQLVRVPAGEMGVAASAHLEALAWSPDGRRLLAAYKETKRDDGSPPGLEVAVLRPRYDAAGGLRRLLVSAAARRAHNGRATAACFLPAPFAFATAGGVASPYEVAVWREAGGGGDPPEPPGGARCVAVPADFSPRIVHRKHTSSVSALACSPDGTLCSGGADQLVVLWQLEVAACVATHRCPAPVNWLGVGAGDMRGSLLASLVAPRDNLEIIDTRAPGALRAQLVLSWALPEAKGLSQYHLPDWSACGRRVALGSKDGNVFVWDVRRPDRPALCPVTTKAIPVVAFPRGPAPAALLAASHERKLHLLSIETRS